LRISMGSDTTPDVIQSFLDVLPGLVERNRTLRGTLR